MGSEFQYFTWIIDPPPPPPPVRVRFSILRFNVIAKKIIIYCYSSILKYCRELNTVCKVAINKNHQHCLFIKKSITLITNCTEMKM